mgnify:CR=1 FL=1
MTHAQGLAIRLPYINPSSAFTPEYVDFPPQGNKVLTENLDLEKQRQEKNGETHVEKNNVFCDKATNRHNDHT